MAVINRGDVISSQQRAEQLLRSRPTAERNAFEGRKVAKPTSLQLLGCDKDLSVSSWTTPSHHGLYPEIAGMSSGAEAS